MGKRYLVDKTPGNGLRLGYVKLVMPDAIVINVIRDGRFNLSSRIQMWEKRPYFDTLRVHFRQFRRMQTTGNLPINRLPTFLADNASVAFSKMVLGRPVVRGERIPGITQILQTRGAHYARAVQWREIVAASIFDGPRLFGTNYHQIRYEDLMTQPAKTITVLLDALALGATAETRSRIDAISAHDVRASHGLTDEELTDVETVVRPLNHF